jgi:hypothetical protein
MKIANSALIFGKYVTFNDLKMWRDHHDGSIRMSPVKRDGETLNGAGTLIINRDSVAEFINQLKQLEGDRSNDN